MKIYLESYGCAASHDDAKIMQTALEKDHQILKNPNKADVIIIQTCVVKEATNTKIKHKLKQFKNKKLIIAGCMAESQQKQCKRLFPNASLINSFNLHKIKEVVEDLQKGKINYFLGKNKENKLKLPKKIEKTSSLQIAQGCTNFCSYCETKLAKGNLQSFQVKDILKEFKRLIKNGTTRINLTSTDNGCYGLDIKTNLPNLLKEILKIKGNYKLRVGMMNPQHLKNDLIEIYKNKKIIKFLHIPVQSGSNKILKLMNRKYTVEDFKEIVKNFRKEIPKIHISTDIIVGFPEETEKDFKKTINLIKEIKPEVLNISKFSSRPGTKASKMQQLDNKLIKERSKKLTEIYIKLTKKN